MVPQHVLTYSDYVQKASRTTRILVYGDPGHAWVTTLLLWLLRLFTFALLLRTYLIPWLLGAMTKRVRIRSISLRSVRGLYIRTGSIVVRAERISWKGIGILQASPITLKVEKLALEIGVQDVKTGLTKPRNGGSRPSLALLSLTPVVHRFRKLLGALLSYLDPIFRPILRQQAVAALRLGIRWLPTYIPRLTFELRDTTVTFAALPGSSLSVREITYSTSIELIETESDDEVAPEPATDRKRITGVTALRNRVADGFKRSLDRALGSTKGKGRMELRVCNVQGYIPGEDEGPKHRFLSLPDTVDMMACMDFNPRAWSIDRHTLELCLKVSDISAKVDLVSLLIDKLKPKVSPPKLSLPSQVNVDSSRFSAFGFPSGSISASIQSALPSFASSFFSPSSQSGAKSPFSGSRFLSPTTIKSPGSPFFRAFSASMRPRRRTFFQPASRLLNTEKISTLAILCKADAKFSSITLSASKRSPLGPYRGVLKSIHLASGLSHHHTTPHHVNWLGKPKVSPEAYDADSYAFTLSMKRMQLERGTRHDSLPLVKVGEQTLHILAHQWPAPFLVVSPFMSGDPNAPYVGAAYRIAQVEATQRLDHLQELLNSIDIVRQSSTKSTRGKPLTPRPLTLPRVSITAEIGAVSAKLIFSSHTGHALRALEFATSGCSFAVHSEYQHATPEILKKYPTASSVAPVRLHCRVSFFAEPISVSTRATMETDASSVYEDPSVLSLGSVELLALFHGIAEADGPGEGTTIIDRESIACECSSAVDALCVELWNPHVIDSVHQILAILPVKKVSTPIDRPMEAKNSRFSKLPFGLTARGSLGQFVVFVTAPDINPNDSLDLSRGVSVRFAPVLECRYLLPTHLHWFSRKDDSTHRLKLKLLDDTLHAERHKIPAAEHDSSIFVRLQLLHTTLRSLVATPFEPSEPLIVERVDAPQLPQDVLKVRQIQFDLRISPNPSTADALPAEDVMEVKVFIPSVRGDVKLCHIYSALLAVQTVKSLRTPRSTVHQTAPVRSKFSFTLEVGIKTVQVYWTLPKRNITTRMDGFFSTISSTSPPRVGFRQLSVFVPLPGRVNRWEGDRPGRWAQLLKLQDWQVFVSPLGDSLSIAVQGTAAHLVIPSGFIFFDLVFDTIIMLKALKHITHITKAGRFWKMPSPPAEGPKSIPFINVRLDFLCVELQDDPFEAKLGLIWQAGFEAAKQRHEREEAFAAKVAAIMLAEQQAGTFVGVEGDYQFSPEHSVGIDDARRRLDKVHVLDWRMRLDRLRSIRQRENGTVLEDLFGDPSPKDASREPDIVPVFQLPLRDPPLLRLSLHDLNLSVAPPSFPLAQLPDYLYKQGSGLPKDTQFSLLAPLHLHFSLSALRATLRDYPLPLIDILPQADGASTVWTFDTDLVIAEEMGTDESVMWFECDVIDHNDALHGEALWSLKIPKTMMPVKTYANASIRIDSPHPTVLAWGVSYASVMQDVMRIVETLTSPPQDPSPVMGFWDKLRLILHWTFDIKFSGDVHVYMKGSRDPYETHDDGAGFVLGWQGGPRLRIGFENEQKELIQLTSDIMVIAVPDLDYVTPNGFAPYDARIMGIPKPFKKVWARLNTGTRFGVGFLPERTCGSECPDCHGPPSRRQCRFFDFKSHWDIKLVKKPFVPEIKIPADSYNGFRSDFVHLSFSLESSLKRSVARSAIERDYSSLHLTPKLFANFWAWCSLFDGAMSLPIRQGMYYPPRPISPKLGRHIATLKYRLSIPHLYVMHGYIDDSRETWADGITTWVGVKGIIDEFSVDMHQREEETQIPGPIPGTTRVVKRKPFYAAELVLKGLDLRALLATFPDSLKKDVPIAAPPHRSNYRQHNELPPISPTSPWHDPNDFVELDWRSRAIPALHLLPVATVPRFAYFKRISSSHTRGATNKFGSEDSHICLLDKEPSAPRAQILLASARAAELRTLIRQAGQRSLSGFDLQTAEKMVALLEDYVTVLQDLDAGRDPNMSEMAYFLPSEMASSSELAEFENVYQLHCPSIFLDSPTRDVLLQYYYCSRARRGTEYHMATRAVKFIRDQANATADVEKEDQKVKPDSMAELAATTLRKILKTDSPKPSVEVRREKPDHTKGKIDPLDGWAEGVSLSKSHCCLLLKPQIVLRGTEMKDTVIVAAGQAKLQIFNIMDNLHMDDPISGKVMSRNYMDLSGLQVYSPLHPLALGNSSIPLEVLIDLRCESTQFERLVPQTDATFHYDRFNRLRLRNKITTASVRVCTDESEGAESHLRSQTDLMRIHVPRFTVSANSQHFQAISNVVTKLLLFSDPVHKTRLDRLETLIFAYDFMDLNSVINVICGLQERLRDAYNTRMLAARDPKRVEGDADKLSFLKLKAHIFLLEEELSLVFDAIKLAQDRFAAATEQNSALLLIASSTEISWRMLDDRTNLISKLVVQNIDFNWLNRQDSSTVNQMSVGNLTAFDGSRTAMWAEIISKFDEPSNHPLVKKKLFCQANWTILAPVGGITIYEKFELAFHPLRLQIDAKVGKRIMEYLWPARREREAPTVPIVEVKSPMSPIRQSLDSPRALQGFKAPEVHTLAAPRRLGVSRSFTDLRGAAEGFLSAPSFLKNNRSSDSLNADRGQKSPLTEGTRPEADTEFTDATVMKNRSSQKSFVFVKISSLNLCLSVVKEGSFECRDARIKTRDLEYRNQTWSFEELVNQFIPSNMGWRGWVKMAFHQPLLPVLPVAKELISKTRWTSKTSSVHDSALKNLHPRILVADDDSRLEWLQNEGAKVEIGAPALTSKLWKKSPHRSGVGRTGESSGLGHITSKPLSTEPDGIGSDDGTADDNGPIAEFSTSAGKRPVGRKRVKSLFTRNKTSKRVESADG